MRAGSVDRPKLLDLFCGAGGASVGYHRAGFDVVGVDNRPQPNYPFEFIQADVFEILRWSHHYHAGWAHFDAVHASPPCQAFTDYKRAGNVKDSPNLIPEIRRLLEATGLPYVIENVQKAAGELRDPIMLCGSMFDLDVQRHRLFEANWPLEPPWMPCRHKIWASDRYPGGASVRDHGVSTALVRRTVEVGTWDIPLKVQQAAMGIDWMKLEELSEAIPPAYTEHIGRQLING